MLILKEIVQKTKKMNTFYPEKQRKVRRGSRREKRKCVKESKKNKDVENPDWKKDSSEFIPLTKAGRINVHPKLEHLEGKTHFDIWSLLTTLDMVDMITVETQQYAHRDKNDLNFYISSSEIYQFLGFLLFTGYHSLPSERDYWSSQPDLHVSFIANEMTRNRYLKIKENFHLADNENLQCRKGTRWQR